MVRKAKAIVWFAKIWKPQRHHFDFIEDCQNFGSLQKYVPAILLPGAD